MGRKKNRDETKAPKCRAQPCARCNQLNDDNLRDRATILSTTLATTQPHVYSVSSLACCVFVCTLSPREVGVREMYSRKRRLALGGQWRHLAILT